jgi:hypothetical protein
MRGGNVNIKKTSGTGFWSSANSGSIYELYDGDLELFNFPLSYIHLKDLVDDGVAIERIKGLNAINSLILDQNNFTEAIN